MLYWVPLSGSFTLAKKTHIGGVWWMFQNLQLQAVQEVCDMSSGVTPCIVMKNEFCTTKRFMQSLKIFLCTTTS